MTTPRKRIVLLLAKDAQQLSILRFLLATRGFTVHGTAEVEQACEWLRGPGEFDAMVTDIGHDQALESLCSIRPDLRVVWLGYACVRPEYVSYMVVPSHGASAVLIEFCRLASRVKRGPKKLLSPMWSAREDAA
jgi:hypothetical protein